MQVFTIPLSCSAHLSYLRSSVLLKWSCWRMMLTILTRERWEIRFDHDVQEYTKKWVFAKLFRTTNSEQEGDFNATITTVSYVCANNNKFGLHIWPARIRSLPRQLRFSRWSVAVCLHFSFIYSIKAPTNIIISCARWCLS